MKILNLEDALKLGYITELPWNTNIDKAKNILGKPISESNPELHYDMPTILFYKWFELYFDNKGSKLEEILVQVWKINNLKDSKSKWINNKLTLSQCINKLDKQEIPYERIYNKTVQLHGIVVNGTISITCEEEALKNGDLLIGRILFKKNKFDLSKNKAIEIIK
jgi:hypothetical protein